MNTLSNEELIAAAMWCSNENIQNCVGCPAFNHCDENDLFSLEKELAKRLQETRTVVLCKDCKYYRESEHPERSGIKFCYRLMHPTENRHIGYNFSDDDFCSYGERKDNDCC